METGRYQIIKILKAGRQFYALYIKGTNKQEYTYHTDLCPQTARRLRQAIKDGTAHLNHQANQYTEISPI